MFIDTAVNPKTCAPAERDVSAMVTRHRLTFRSSGARRSLLYDGPFYKHYVPTGRETI
jgi:hypothetical protein